MADPSSYAVSYSFSGFQANNPALPLPAPKLDNELAQIAASTKSLVSAMQDVRRSDGALKTGVVTLDSLSAGVIVGLANLDTDSAAALDAAVAAIQAGVDDAIAVIAATKADIVHTHTATQVSVAAITGLISTTVQDALAELRGLGPQTGDIKLSMVSTAPNGWVACNDGTIGPVGSGATYANANAQALYSVLWNEIADAYAPVVGGRSANAAADWALLRPITLTQMLGRALAIAGSGTGLTVRAAGQALGEETHILSVTEMPSHNHGGSTGTSTFPKDMTTSGIAGGSAFVQTNNAGPDVGTITLPAQAITAQGGGSGHNVVQPTTFLRAFLKL